MIKQFFKRLLLLSTTAIMPLFIIIFISTNLYVVYSISGLVFLITAYNLYKPMFIEIKRKRKRILNESWSPNNY